MDYCGILTKSSLFQGMDAEEIRSVLSCLNAKQQTFKKGEFIFCSGVLLEMMGMVLAGTVHILSLIHI